MNYIFYLMGKSSSGKDTLYQKIKNKMPEIVSLVGYTTRPIRENEQNGREYFFVTSREMEEMEQRGIVIEKRSYHTVHGVWNYFTADDGQVKNMNNNYILIGTLQSFQKVRDYYGKERVIPIYIEVDNGIRLKRALEREMGQLNPKYAELCRRFLADEEDFSEENILSCGIEKKFINDDLERCLEEIIQYMRNI